METYLTIYVTFEGLGFGCFNSARKRAEIAFLRLPKHNLKITVTGSDGRCKVIDRIEIGDEIELLSGGTLVDGLRLNNDGDFDRSKGINSLDNDPFDLRWLVDFEGGELHDRGAMRETETPNSVRGLTKMFLPNAYFFAEQLLSAEYQLLEAARQPRSFGQVSDTLCGKIDATAADLQINKQSVFDFSESVKPNTLTRFMVNITNICDPPPTLEWHSDFQKYYEILNPGDGLKYDFEPVNPPTWGPRPAMCDFILLGKTANLDEF